LISGCRFLATFFWLDGEVKIMGIGIVAAAAVFFVVAGFYST